MGAAPVSRQGNLIVESSKTMTDAQLRAKLIELVKEQKKSYGLLIDDNMDADSATTHDLADALDAVLAGKPVAKTELRAFGCTIKRTKPIEIG